MANVAAGIIGAFISLVGVVVGVWLNGRREHRRWIRDQQLKAAVAFIGATGELYADKRGRQTVEPSGEQRRKWIDTMRDGRSALYLLCDHNTVDLAEELVQSLYQTERSSSKSHDDETIALLRRFTQHLRRELGVPADTNWVPHSKAASTPPP